MPRETSAAIGELFRGFSGYVQADAKSVYDLLFKPAAERPPLDDGEPDLDERHEVGCWSHCRRKAWEVAITSKDPVAREAVLCIKRIFDLDRSWRGKPPDEIRSLRQPKTVWNDRFPAVVSSRDSAEGRGSGLQEASLSAGYPRNGGRAANDRRNRSWRKVSPTWEWTSTRRTSWWRCSSPASRPR